MHNLIKLKNILKNCKELCNHTKRNQNHKELQNFIQQNLGILA